MRSLSLTGHLLETLLPRLRKCLGHALHLLFRGDLLGLQPRRLCIQGVRPAACGHYLIQQVGVHTLGRAQDILVVLSGRHGTARCSDRKVRSPRDNQILFEV